MDRCDASGVVRRSGCLRHQPKKYEHLSAQILSPKRFQLANLFLVFLFGFSMRLEAQTSTGELTIYTKDFTSALIASAKVELTGTETKAPVRSLHTDDNGFVEVPLLPPGVYAATITAPGFKSFVRSGFLASVDRIVSLDIQMAVGQIDESVTVTGEATLLETKSETIAQVMSGKQVTDLRLKGETIYRHLI